jgi:subtilisin family serine protease
MLNTIFHPRRGNMKDTFVRLSLFTILLAALCGCEITDNQKIIDPAATALANPKPLDANFSENNKAHRILMAIVDSGVDYNHPELLKHMHFDLDTNGAPVGAGWDFTGNDAWPSPYLVRTGYYDPVADTSRVEASKKAKKNYETALRMAPEWTQTFLEPLRSLDQEVDSGAYHGTHVAGLMTYDRSELGLLAYRVLPRNIIGKFESDTETIENAANNINLAVEQAVKSGAKILNFSLAFSAKSTDSTYESIKKLSKAFEVLVAKHPDVLFVAAVGNEGGWIDGDVRINFPCSVKQPNILCVGALQKDGRAADFTNLVLNGAEIVFALGVDVISTIPMKICPSDWIKYIKIANSDSNVQTYLEHARKDCAAVKGFKALSGTSMASPLTARVAALAWLENPNLSPAEVIQKIKFQGSPGKIGEMPITRLKIDLPSWYSRLGFVPTRQWEAYVPRK